MLNHLEKMGRGYDMHGYEHGLVQMHFQSSEPEETYKDRFKL